MKKSIVLNVLIMMCLMGCNSAIAQVKEDLKNAILLVAFGTSYNEAQVAFQNIEKKVHATFPGVEVRWAYTSKTIRKILRKRGVDIDSPAEALAKMGEDGFTHVAVQSLHIIPGFEYENLKKTVEAFNNIPEGIRVSNLGKPLLYHHNDNQNLASLIDNEFSKNIDRNSAVVFMGHGTEHPTNIYYPGFQYYLKQKSNNYFLGTVEGFPLIGELLVQLKQQKIKNVLLTPFMSVAGDHAQNDMAGDEKDSWKSILEAEGFSVEIIMKGLAEYDAVVEIWIDHLKELSAITTVNTHNTDDCYLIASRSYSYNDKSQKTGKLSFDKDKVLITRVGYLYDGQGNKIETRKHLADSTLIVKYVYQFDSNNLKVKSTKYDFLKNSQTWKKYSYDTKKQNIQTEYYNGEKLLRTIKYKYNNRGDIIRKSSFNTDGDLMDESLYEYAYKDSFLVEKITFSSENKMVSKTVYGYDSKGNKTNHCTYYFSGKRNNKKRIYEYDKYGRSINTNVYEFNTNTIDKH